MQRYSIYSIKKDDLTDLTTFQATINENSQVIITNDHNIRLAFLQQNPTLLRLKKDLGDAKTLFEKFNGAIQKTLSSYDETHVLNQTARVRRSIYTIRQRISTVSFLNAEGNNFSAEKRATNTYFCLCGLLYENMREANDPEFSTALNESLRSFLCVDVEDSIREYGALSGLFRHVPFEEHEENEYKTALGNFEAALKRYPVHTKELTQFNKLVRLLKSTAENLDKRHSTLILQKAAERLNNPRDGTVKANFQLLINLDMTNLPSTCKEYLGIFLAFIGAVTALISLALKVVTFGLSAPLTNTTLVAGGGTFLYGSHMFYRNRETGMRRVAKEFNTGVESAQKFIACERKR